jgi:hypothetical protein
LHTSGYFHGLVRQEREIIPLICRTPKTAEVRPIDAYSAGCLDWLSGGEVGYDEPVVGQGAFDVQWASVGEDGDGIICSRCGYQGHRRCYIVLCVRMS